MEPYIKSQNDFCENNNKYLNEKYENEIFLVDIKLIELEYPIYLFKSNNFIVNQLKEYGAFEKMISYNIIDALGFYSRKKKYFK